MASSTRKAAMRAGVTRACYAIRSPDGRRQRHRVRAADRRSPCGACLPAAARSLRAQAPSPAVKNSRSPSTRKIPVSPCLRGRHERQPVKGQLLSSHRRPRARPGLKTAPAVVNRLRRARRIDAAIVARQHRRKRGETVVLLLRRDAVRFKTGQRLHHQRRTQRSQTRKKILRSIRGTDRQFAPQQHVRRCPCPRPAASWSRR